MATAPTTVHELRRQVQNLVDTANPYPFLAVAEDYLAAVPVDDQLRATAVRFLADLGLRSVAAEIARTCPAQSPYARQMRDAADEFARSQTDIIDVAETEEQFNSHLAILRERGQREAELAEALAHAWCTGGDGLAFHRAGNGNFYARATRSDGRRIWVPGLANYRDGIETLGDISEWTNQMLVPFCIEGVGMGWLLPRLHAASQGTYLNYSPAIYVIEPNLRALAVVLRLQDWSMPLADPRVYLFSGPDAWEQWKTLMRENDNLTPPQQVTVLSHWPGAPAAMEAKVVREVLEQRDATYEAQCRRVEAVYDGCDLAYWARRFAAASNGDPLRVLCISSRYTTFLQYSTRDLMAALSRVGIVTRLVIEDHDHALLSRQRHMKEYADFRPDLILVIDHHRHEHPERHPRNVPYVCWIQDELPALFARGVGEKLGPLDFTIGFGRTQSVLRFGYPADRFMPCKMAIDPGKFAPPEGEPPVDPALTCDVVYISHHAESPLAFHDRLRKVAGSDALERLMDAFYEQMSPLMSSERFNAGYDLDGLLVEAGKRVGLRITDTTVRERTMSYYVRPLADRILRHATLGWVADWAEATGRSLHVYGRGWEEHPRFARYARGVAEHGEMLGRICRSAAINLHTGMNIALHQRVLETIGAGGFLLVRYNPFGFYPAANESLYRFLVERGIDRPTRIPLAELPADYVEVRRQRMAVTGRPMPDYVDITAEFLLEQEPGSVRDRRYDYASLAFPGFERITFDGSAAFAQRAEYYLARPDERQVITREMRGAVEELFTYDALVRRLIPFIREGLARGAS